ncbi:MAG: hypothetical protein JWO81_956 [Alphaproteobacteria bacterium]|nr:hypothetical protein [Alphaproteobacteria bacterium]
MKSHVSAMLLAAMAVAGCQQSRSNDNQTAAAARAEKPVAPAPVAKAAPAAQAAPAADCALPPKLALAAGFADPRKAFAPGSPAFRQTEAHFDAAYRKACATGVLRGHALMQAGAAQPDTLFLKNAPEANTASIYRDGERGGPAAGRVMVLEYFFLPADGATRAPTADELGDAIFCAAQGASAREQDESGRCLVD